MRRGGSGLLVLLMAAAAAAPIVGCAQEEYPESLWMAQHPSADAAVEATLSGGDAGAEAEVDSGPQFCQQARATALPARLAAISASPDAGADGASAAGTKYYVADLFQLYTGVCGSCHGTVQGLGGFDIVTQQDFQTLMTTDVLKHVTSNGPSDPNKPSDPTDLYEPMPPLYSAAGKPFKDRADTDPVRHFATLAQQWLALMKPSSFVVVDSASGGDAGASGTEAHVPLPTAAIGNDMTDIGNCVPSAGLVNAERALGADLDAKFAAAKAQAPGSGVTPAQMIGLPEHLRDTDLFTFDSAVLARYGVVAYAPGYPLWTDGAGKLRYIRVPRGASVKFDKATQSFSIPANTRFYKTFMKPVVDTDGSVRNRKLETRLIVSRPDLVASNGTRTPQALFGTYRWNDDESDAVLVEVPLNTGKPFADTVFTFVADEPLAADVLSDNPVVPDQALLDAHATRHYATPSSQRCVDCHSGSESQSFVLGFLPLQIKRRAQGEGGTIEPTGADELTQLERLVQYGVITGVDSPDDVLPLEASQGSRKPRNDYELVAQGYMLGNCAHCHNPGGLPSVQNGVLSDILNFYPGPQGGIFQFPLERTSPRIFRGTVGQTPIPYITPSLMDLPRFTLSGDIREDVFATSGEGYVIEEQYAPWRSLIYRNVDNAFAYTDDLALFPHMPMHSLGFDPRARQIFSDWMVSIPAVRKSPDILEYAFFGSTAGNGTPFDPELVIGDTRVDTNPQPYVEVPPGDPRYPDALAAAQARLNVLHTGVNPAATINTDPKVGPVTVVYSRYADPGEPDDVLDPAVVQDPVCHPVPGPPSLPPSGPGGPVPAHAHWVVSDATQTPGAWQPRRPDWASVLVSLNTDSLTTATSCTEEAEAQKAALEDERIAIGLLQSVTLDAPVGDHTVRSYLTTKVPFGLWQEKPGCDFSGQKTLGSYTDRTTWMNVVAKTSSPPPSSAPVYEQSPGQAVFKMICINCHGPAADSNGRLAQNLTVMTGGVAQVADFRDGLFGSYNGAPNIPAVFGAAALPAGAPAAWQRITADDRAARYLAWMALGGTEVRIPQGVLQIVALTQVLDQHRQAAASNISANMLSTANSICTTLLGCHNKWGENCGLDPSNVAGYSKTLIHTNYDAELWLHVCALDNPAPVHLVTHGVVDQPFDANTGAFFQQPGDLVKPGSYPARTRVGSDHGTQPSLTPDNPWPWCETDVQFAAAAGSPPCPLGLDVPANELTIDEANAWTVRGAINAGLGVFLYVKDLVTTNTPPPDYNQCEKLP